MTTVMNNHKDSPITLETVVQRSRTGIKARNLFLSLVLLLATWQCSSVIPYLHAGLASGTETPLRSADILDKCRLLQVPPGPPPNFHTRLRSDRFVSGTAATLITVRTFHATRALPYSS